MSIANVYYKQIRWLWISIAVIFLCFLIEYQFRIDLQYKIDSKIDSRLGDWNQRLTYLEHPEQKPEIVTHKFLWFEHHR